MTRLRIADGDERHIQTESGQHVASVRSPEESRRIVAAWNAVSVLGLSIEALELAGMTGERDITPAMTERERQVWVMVEALRECSSLFSAIREDWSDPRNEIRAGQECIKRALLPFEGRP